MAERWDGVRWSFEPTPYVPQRGGSPGLYGHLDSVSCTSPTFCMAVGAASAGGGLTLSQQWAGRLTEQWDGTRWTLVRHPAVPGVLYSVSCTSSRFCVAVGGSGQDGVGPAFIEHWDGHRWTVMKPPRARGDSAFLNGVSCQSRRRCVAVGGWYAVDKLRGGTLVEEWNGGRWTVRPSQDAGEQAELTSVSCAGQSCFAVGFSCAQTVCPGRGFVEDGMTPLVELRSSDGWRRQLTALHRSVLNAISCPAARACFAVGSAAMTHGSSLRAVAEWWDGRRWAIQPTQNPARPPGVHPAPDRSDSWGPSLESLSCRSARSCRAVGSADLIVGSFTGSHAFAERYP